MNLFPLAKLRNRLYYQIKPMLPWSLRMAVRRGFARWQRQRVKDIWPILPGSELPPANWQGWPEGKRFAFVLTHDVQTLPGLDKCRQVMDLETDLGFRSSFNFIPEGRHAVPSELRNELTCNGFEVGVHDLNRDGKLYEGHGRFIKRAAQINQHLQDWGAVGFRSAFMHRNLDWLHELNLEYDSSTFDTDPFEPQPDGTGTIFPFWVPQPETTNTNSLPRGSRSHDGYVELPYTLPQDSTLFLLFRERSSDLWLRKLDWVAKHGGMALLDVHPDYLSFDNRSTCGQYPVSRYVDLLGHVADRHKGAFWHATPAELARWYRRTLGANDPEERKRFVGKRAAVVLYSDYKSDARPRREAEALVKSGMEVDVICLRQNPAHPKFEHIHGVNVRRMPMQHRRKGKIKYLLQYASFIAFCTAMLGWRSLRKRYDLVHVHNMPDVLVFSGIVPKLRGARILLDLHDPMPELMTTIFGLKEESVPVRILKHAERLSMRFADQVLTVNLACKKIFGSRSCDPGKIQVVMNSPDEEIFRFCPFQEPNGQESAKPFVIMYHGSIVQRNGLDLAVQALQMVRQTIPNAELRVYGSSTPFLELVRDSVPCQALENAFRYLGAKSLEEISEAIGGCDLGIIPNHRCIFTELNTPTRIFEYLSQGKPVIAPFAPGITDYFGREDLVYFELGNAADLARKILQVHAHRSEMKTMVERGQEIYRAHCWKAEKLTFLNTVSQLLGDEARSIDRSGRAVSNSKQSARGTELLAASAPSNLNRSGDA